MGTCINHPKFVKWHITSIFSAHLWHISWNLIIFLWVSGRILGFVQGTHREGPSSTREAPKGV